MGLVTLEEQTVLLPVEKLDTFVGLFDYNFQVTLCEVLLNVLTGMSIDDAITLYMSELDDEEYADFDDTCYIPIYNILDNFLRANKYTYDNLYERFALFQEKWIREGAEVLLDILILDVDTLKVDLRAINVIQ